MKIRVSKSNLNGSVDIPGSKSHTIRGFVFGMLAKGESRIIRPLLSADTLSCIEGCKSLGASVKILNEEPKTVIINGISGRPEPIAEIIDVGNSGTSLRLLTAAACLCDSKIKFDGDASIRQRPMQPLLKALASLGAETSSENNNGKCPVYIKGPLKGGTTEVDGVSSQFLSALLITAPLIPYDTIIKVNVLNEKPYVEMTLQWLQEMGISLVNDNFKIFKIPGGQSYNAFTKQIPSDFSTACFPLTAAAVTKSEIIIKGLDFKDSQGDRKVFDYLKYMGIQIKTLNNDTIINAKDQNINGIEIDLNSTPDALPVLAVLSCFAKGRTILKNVPQARIKECDRIAAMTKELKKMGANIEELPDGMIINHSWLKPANLHGYNDHRIIMALAIAGMGCEGTTTVDTAENIGITYPDFIAHMKQLGANIESIND